MLFQKRTKGIPQGLDGVQVQVIMDDILISGNPDRKLDAVIYRIYRSKCIFRESRLPFKGHLVGQDGIYPDPEKVRAIL